MLFNTINFENIEYYKTSEYMFLDPQTRKNLGLSPDKNTFSNSFSLFNTLNITKTSMGARLLKNYLGQPLINIEKIKERQEIISWFYENENLSSKLANKLEKIIDQTIKGETPKSGSYRGRINSEPENNRKTLMDIKNA